MAVSEEICRLSSKTVRCLKMKALCSFKLSGTNYPLTGHHIPEELSMNRHPNLKTPIFATDQHSTLVQFIMIALYIG
jgi:hypothetical protein